MKPPTRVKIGPYRYRLEVDVEPADDGDVGTTIPMKQLIRITPGQSPDYERDTVLHEVLHAVFFNTNLRKMSGWEPPMEEAIIHALSPALVLLFRENPRLMDYLMSDEA